MRRTECMRRNAQPPPAEGVSAWHLPSSVPHLQTRAHRVVPPSAVRVCADHVPCHVPCPPPDNPPAEGVSAGRGDGLEEQVRAQAAAPLLARGRFRGATRQQRVMPHCRGGSGGGGGGGGGTGLLTASCSSIAGRAATTRAISVPQPRLHLAQANLRPRHATEACGTVVMLASRAVHWRWARSRGYWDTWRRLAARQPLPTHRSSHAWVEIQQHHIIRAPRKETALGSASGLSCCTQTRNTPFRPHPQPVRPGFHMDLRHVVRHARYSGWIG